MTNKTVTLAQILTEAEIAQAVKLYQEAEPGTFARRCAAEIIEPVIGRINQALGQENSALYLAYAVEYILIQRELTRREKGDN